MTWKSERVSTTSGGRSTGVVVGVGVPAPVAVAVAADGVGGRGLGCRRAGTEHEGGEDGYADARERGAGSTHGQVLFDGDTTSPGGAGRGGGGRQPLGPLSAWPS